MNLQNFTWDKDAEGIVTITWDMPGRTMNVISPAVLKEMEQWVGAIASDDSVKGVILTSGKPTFSAGADLTELQTMLGLTGDAAALADGSPVLKKAFDNLMQIHKLMRGLETCGKPVVAAINGTALGGGLELCLACHHRIAADEPAARIGLPESKVGILPGAGGTQRLSRMLGAMKALPLMLEGRTLPPGAAKDEGLVDAVVPPAELLAAARTWLKDNPKAAQPWEDKGFRIPGGGPYSRTGGQVFQVGNAMLRKQTYANYPAQLAIMKCVYEGLLVPIDAGLRIEARYFLDVFRRPESRAMIRTLFLSMQALEKGARRPQRIEDTKVTRLGVLGAGVMGAGIAHVSAAAGIHVVLIDRDQASADKGKAHTAEILDKDIARGRGTEERKAEILGNIHPTPDYAALKDCDLVIEAVFEDRGVKAEATAKAEATLPASAIFGTNTSTLPITGLAEASKRPERFIGIHFFSPVERMGLVEIIRGKKTSDEALAWALDYVRQIKKTPIVVNDSRGFYTSRCFGTYATEGAAMLTEGVKPALIENLGRMAGMPMGPLEVTDSVGIDVPLKIIRAARKDAAVTEGGKIEAVYAYMAETQKRLGRKNGKGFYDYNEDGKRLRLWPDLMSYGDGTWHTDDNHDELKKRLIYIQALEAARCYEEGVVTDPRDADVGAILGWGFAPFTGGPLSMIDTIGADVFVKELNALAKRHGDRFKPNKLLRDMAKSGEGFYARFTKAQKAA